MSADTRLLIVPQEGGRQDADFDPWPVAWLRAESAGRTLEIEGIDRPRPERPDVVAWPAAIAKALSTDPGRLTTTYVLAHSVHTKNQRQWQERCGAEVRVFRQAEILRGNLADATLAVPAVEQLHRTLRPRYRRCALLDTKRLMK